jgi:hypothetical protein
MNPRRFRYCLIAAALAVALWRLPGASSSSLFSAGPYSADGSANGAAAGHDPAQAPPAPGVEQTPAAVSSSR